MCVRVCCVRASVRARACLIIQSRRLHDTGMPNWDGVRGCHGVEKMNGNGESLLSFYALNELVIMNTTFEKKLHKYTWQHAGSKKGCIYYIIMRQARSYDVTVLRSVDCCTDDKLLRAQLRVHSQRGLRSLHYAVKSINKVYWDNIGRNWWSLAKRSNRATEVGSDQEQLAECCKSSTGTCEWNQPDWFRKNKAPY